ncbi:hypothetical protein F2Q70_00015679 [Brassica cretica]|uniref:Uncharacterized protein n=1 Tax=Brassica cretica TaxID=69181 RepID=A0A3N6T9Z3_BRACR|nr:hypothetical protein F2Q70_00015679 [Brassica cretica]
MEIVRRCRQGSSASYASSVATSLSSANTKESELDTQTQLLSCLVIELSGSSFRSRIIYIRQGSAQHFSSAESIEPSVRE